MPEPRPWKRLKRALPFLFLNAGDASKCTFNFRAVSRVVRRSTSELSRALRGDPGAWMAVFLAGALECATSPSAHCISDVTSLAAPPARSLCLLPVDPPPPPQLFLVRFVLLYIGSLPARLDVLVFSCLFVSRTSTFRCVPGLLAAGSRGAACGRCLPWALGTPGRC